MTHLNRLKYWFFQVVIGSHRLRPKYLVIKLVLRQIQISSEMFPAWKSLLCRGRGSRSTKGFTNFCFVVAPSEQQPAAALGTADIELWQRRKVPGDREVKFLKRGQLRGNWRQGLVHWAACLGFGNSGTTQWRGLEMAVPAEKGRQSWQPTTVVRTLAKGWPRQLFLGLSPGPWWHRAWNPVWLSPTGEHLPLPRLLPRPTGLLVPYTDSHCKQGGAEDWRPSWAPSS